MSWTIVSDGSTIAGYISILFWLIVFIPQLQENYKRQNGDGLSLTFLYIWLAGDLFNLAGIIMERLMFTMFLLALWYTIADISLIWQVIYYKQCVIKSTKIDQDEAIVLLASKKKKLKNRGGSWTKSAATHHTNNTKIVEAKESEVEEDVYDGDSELDSNDLEDTINPPKIKPIWVNLIGSSVLIALILGSCYAYVIMSTHPPIFDNNEDIRLIPQILGWLSAVLYVGSRLPQLIKNWRQQSTEGLSSGMFICAVFGNAFFTLSILLKSTERRYILVNLSWIIGSLGTVIFDIMIFLQFYVFNRRKLKHRAD